MRLQRFTANIIGQPRTRKLEGREYYVFPVRILRQGVLDGSGGPTLFRGRDIQRYLSAWDNKPIIVNHPRRHGRYVSCADPSILERSKVGFIMRNRWDGEYQHAEAWIDKKRIRKVEPRIETYIKNRMTMEVSCGVESDSIQKRGQWRGQKYKQIASRYRPDHLALLPDEVGACSCANGCGMFTASKGVSPKRMKRVQEAIALAWNGKKPSCSCRKGKSMKTKQSKKKMSRREKISSLISAKVGWRKKDREWLKRLDGEDLNQLLVHATRLKPVDTKLRSPSSPAPRHRDRDREEEATDESPRRRRRKDSKKKKTTKKSKRSHKQKLLMAERKRRKRMKAKKKSKPLFHGMSAKQVVNALPGQLREIFSNGLRAHGSERRRLIDIIVSSDRNQFEKEELKDEDIFPIRRLRKLAHAFIETEGDNDPYSSFVGGAGAPIANSSRQRITDEEHLELPTMPLPEDEDE